MEHDADGRIVDVGAKTRTIPPALRRALLYRDRRCRFPGCHGRFCQAHHIRHWAHGGPTTLSNLVAALPPSSSRRPRRGLSGRAHGRWRAGIPHPAWLGRARGAVSASSAGRSGHCREADNEEHGIVVGPTDRDSNLAGRASRRWLCDGCAPSAREREAHRRMSGPTSADPASLDRLVRPGHDRASPDEPAGVHGRREGLHVDPGHRRDGLHRPTAHSSARGAWRIGGRHGSQSGRGAVRWRADRRAGRARRRHPVRGRDADDPRREARAVINLAYGLGMGEGNPHLAMRLDILGMDNVFEAAG